MPKSIVFCADGTWNGPGQGEDSPDDTNVLKLYRNLLGEQTDANDAPEQEKSLSDGNGVSQVAKYLHGVGDSSNLLAHWAGGLLGAGLVARILRGYTFVSRNWHKDDRILLIGFSRGAYAVRGLAGLIAAQGLLDATRLDLSDRQAAYRLGAAVWQAYRQAHLATMPGDLVGGLENWIAGLPGIFGGPVPGERVTDVTIDTVAVWDTVGSLGIPEYAKDEERIDLFQFADTSLNPKVLHGVQALAVDERRADFTPTLWGMRDGVEQCLFPGAHGDVGGGYPANESGLSNAALEWLVKHIDPDGLVRAADPAGLPKPDSATVAHEPWQQPPFNELPQHVRSFPPSGLGVSRSLVDRLHAGPVQPAPREPAACYVPASIGAYLKIDPAPGVTVWETDGKLASSAP